MKTLAIRNLLLVVAALSVTAPPAEAAGRPNIVILYADDMGYGDLGVQNPESRIPTPHLDRLASQGTRFTDAHSSSGVCTPSRYALLHGRYHWRKFHGIVNAFDQPILDADRTTLPELLKTKGYKTACIGKWHLGWDWNSIKRPGAKAEDRKGSLRVPLTGASPFPADHCRMGSTTTLATMCRTSLPMPGSKMTESQPSRRCRSLFPKRQRKGPGRPDPGHRSRTGTSGQSCPSSQRRLSTGSGSRRPMSRSFSSSPSPRHMRRSCRPLTSPGNQRPAASVISSSRPMTP